MGDVCQLVSGQHIAAEDYNVDRRGVGYLTGPSDFGDVNPVVSKWTEHPKVKARAGDILITVKGSGVGKINWLDLPEVAISRQLMAIRAGTALPAYVYAFLAYSFEHFQSEATGAAIPGLSREQVLSLSIPLPLMEEQQRIVSILDEAFEGIATAKGNAEKNLQNARELFEGYAKSAFLQIADRCPIKTLDQLAENLDSKRVPITKSDRKSGAFPYYGASGIVDHVDGYIFDGDALLISEDGANLLARSTPIAFPATGRYWVNNHAHILKFEHMATQRFVEFFLESIPLDDYITGAAQPKLNQKALNTIPIPIPSSIEEQAQVVARLEGISEQCESLEVTYQRKLTALDELKKSLLHQAFSGKL